jgi:O-antigen biosynthesis protein
VPLSDRTRRGPAAAELEQLGIEVLTGVTNLGEELQRRAGLYDAAIISRPHNARFITMVKQFNPNAAIVYDAEAVFAVRENLQAEVEGRTVLPAEAETRIRAEVASMAEADVVLTVAEPESRVIRRYDRDIDVRVWGDCQPVCGGARKFADRRDLLFVGNLATPPNADAVRHALREIFPRIRALLDCRLFVAGAGAPESLLDGAIDVEAVVLTGFVKDLSRLYDRCRVFIAPHRFAGGVPHKVIEAMAAGVPCVVSELLGRQLEAVGGEELLIAGDAREFAEKTARLYHDEALWHRLRENGIRLVQQRYDPDMMRDLLRQCVEDAMLRNCRTASPRTDGAR